MSISPDFTPYVDLTLYDKDATDIVAAAQATLQSRIPDWVPASTNIEMMLLEAMAIEVSETIYSLNRLPVSMVRVLLSLYGVEENPGSPPTVSLQFNAYDTDGYVIPAGTEVAILMASGTYLSFFTDAEAVVGEGNSFVATAATSTTYTNVANGMAIGTSCELIDAITGIDTVETASLISGGVLPETVEAWTERGVQRLQRLVDTLVIPAHFTSAALEDANVFRANTLDNWDGSGGAPGDDPGHVAVVVYGDAGALTAPQKATLLADLEARANANLIIHIIDPTVTTQAVTAEIAVLPTYNSTAVIEAVEARLTEYLSPTTWPWAGTIRRFELISVIDQVEGVDYVNTLTVPAADVNLTAGSTLASAGVLTITAL